LQLYRLTNLEITSLQKELDQLAKLIDHLKSLLGNTKKLMGVIKEELLEIKNKYGINRRSEIQGEIEEIKVNLEVMVAAEEVLVTLSREGYLKRTSLLSFTRSGGELQNTGLKEGDFVRFLFEINTIENLLIFTAKGQYYLLPVHQIPEYKWKDNGTAIVNVIPIAKEDRIVNVIPIKDFNDPDKSFVMFTRLGQVKRTELKEYLTSRSIGIVACKVADNDEVVQVLLSDNSKEMMLFTKLGMSIRFRENEVNSMGRVSTGVKGIQLKEKDEVISAIWVEGDEGEILVLSDLGYGKRSLLLDYPIQGRGGKGILTFEFKEGKRVKPNGTSLIKAYLVKEEFHVAAYLKNGMQHSFSTEKTSIDSRISSGKQLIPTDKTDILDVVKIT
jgi:topoisomerase-4 subunit A